MSDPSFTDSELYTILESMKEYKKTHSCYCDNEGLEEFDSILSKLKQWNKSNCEFGRALNVLINCDNTTVQKE